VKKGTIKVFSLVMVMIMMISVLAGCTGKAQEAPAAEATPAPTVAAEQVELDIFQFKVEIAKELDAAARAYEAEHPNVKINIQTVGGGEDYGAALRAKFQSGSEPDIYNIGGPQDVQDWMTKLEDLSDQTWLSDAVSGVLTGVTVDGKTYGVPFNIEGYGFIYNKAIFEAAGIDGSKISDFEALESAVKTLDAKIKAGELKDKFPMLEAVMDYPAKETWVTGLHTSNAVLNQEFGGPIEAFNAKTIEFKNADALKALIDLQADYSPFPKSKGKLNAVTYSRQVAEGLATERVAMIQQGNWIFNEVNGIDAEVANNLDILPMPVKGVKEDSIPIGVPMYWAINKNSKDAEKAAAKDFLSWLYTSDAGKDFVVNKFFFIPPFKGYDGFEPKDALGKAVKRYADQGKTMTWVFMGYPTGWGMEVLGVEIQKYFAGENKWEDVLANSKAKWEESRK